MSNQTLEINAARGWWQPNGGDSEHYGAQALADALLRVGDPVFVYASPHGLGVSHKGTMGMGSGNMPSLKRYPLKAYLPPLHPATLGDQEFKQRHGLRYAYVVGAMANGITSAEMVAAAGRMGMIGFFGAAGLSPAQVTDAIHDVKHRCQDTPYGFNLIHSPSDPELENHIARLYIEHGVDRVSASAYLDLTLPLVGYRVAGIHRNAEGEVVCPHKVIAKVSRVEVARKFLAPPPLKLLKPLVESGQISQTQADLAAHVAMADDLTAEADSGGHTDNRPAISLLPTLMALRDEMAATHGLKQLPSVGLGGGIATPHAAAAAFAMGAAYVLAGSIHQGCVEAGTSEAVRHMLCQAQQADVIMAPSADMFEMGVKVQVLKRGTMFPLRAAKLYELYCAYGRYEEIPAKQRQLLERDFFRCSFEQEWERTRQFFALRDPRQVQRAEKDPRHKMALVFRAYLGKSSIWAQNGEPSRKIDYQIWCGPAMGAFNQWVRGSFLEQPQHRDTVSVALNLLLWAALITRVQWLKGQHIPIPVAVQRFAPLPKSDILEILN